MISQTNQENTPTETDQDQDEQALDNQTTTEGKEFESKIERISPRLAKEYLEKSIPNRAISPHRVNTIFVAMCNGKFEITQPISFDISGRLIDGRHRLSAIIKYGTAVRMPVQRNVPIESIRYFDVGQSRTVSQALRIAGRIENFSIISPIVLKLLRFSGYVKAGDQDTVERLYDKYKAAIDFANQYAYKSKYTQHSTILKAAVVKAYYYVNRQNLKRFCSVFINNEIAEAKDSTPVSLRNFFMVYSNQNLNVSLTQEMILQACRLIDAYDKNVAIQRIIVSKKNDPATRVSMLNDLFPLEDFIRIQDSDPATHRRLMRQIRAMQNGIQADSKD